MSQNIFRFLSCVRIYKKLLLLLLMTVFTCSNIFAQKRIKKIIKKDISELENRSDFTPKDTTYINLLNELSIEYRFYNSDSLFLLAKKALKNSKLANHITGKIEAYNYLGLFYSDQGMHDKGVVYLKQAYKLAVQANKTVHVLDIHNSLALEYQYQNTPSKALNEYLKAVEISEKNNNNFMLSVLYENIALLYVDQKDYDQAIDYFKIVKKINEKFDNKLESAYTASNMADLYSKMNKLDLAMFSANSSISVFEKHEILDWLAYAYGIKGDIYLKRKLYDRSLFWYNQSKALHMKSIEDPRAEINLFWGISEANLGLGNDDIALEYALKGFNIAQRLHSNNGLKTLSKTLYKIHKHKEDYLKSLAYHELHQELSDTISTIQNEKNLILLKTQLRHKKQKDDLIAENEKTLAKQNNYIYASLAILMVLLVITILVRRNENNQRRLNKQLNLKKNILETREVELQKINKTKDKLFSIIGHDLRGPIGAFEGLLELFSEGEITQKELLNLISKLRLDIHHISFTLNNLLTWGQTQMKGSVTKPSKMSLLKIAQDNINLLSEIADRKSIRIVNQIKDDAFAWSDANQIDIVIRNLISNALKFTPIDGVITVSAKDMDNHWIISISDTGVGINPEVKDDIFCENEKITTYGTNNEKGTGLGLSLCKEMVENNNGTIWVESTLNQGSIFYFTVPKIDDKYDKAS